MSLIDKIRTLFRLFLLFTVLVAVALVSAITTIRLTIHGHQETMPKLVGQSMDSAQRVASGLGLELKVEDKLYSSQYPTNAIVSQMPPPGTRIKMGQHVHILVSLGAPQMAVPNVVGSSLRAARIAAMQRGLTVADVAMVHWPEGEADQVVAQDPPPENTEVRTPTVNFLVSAGESPPSFLTPNFVGQPIDATRRTVEKNGFKVGHVTPIPTDAVKKGTILSQSPMPGSEIAPESVFSFEVAQ